MITDGQARKLRRLLAKPRQTATAPFTNLIACEDCSGSTNKDARRTRGS